MSDAGATDVARAASALAMRLPPELSALARLAFNYWWCWATGGEALFRSLDANRWEQSGENPVRLLQEISAPRLQELAGDTATVAAANDLLRRLDAELGRPPKRTALLPGRPAAFLCAEFGIHRSLPIYSGGLGVLAGDFLKEASDQALPLVAVGLMYSQGYFHQRLEISGWQQEYWTPTDPDREPAALVRGADGHPLMLNVPIRGHDVAVQIWRIDVGRVPMYLLDTDLPENARVDRWITARLYIGDRQTRLAQYMLLGIGGVQALRALGIDPSLVFLNEGHAALASLELAREGVAAGLDFDEALEAARRRAHFITHTPVAAGNDTFSNDELGAVLDDLPDRLGLDVGRFLRLGRVRPDDNNEPFGMTPLALRVSSTANGVSRLHGQVAREMWHDMWPERAIDQVPIGHVTNGVHLSTWMSPEMQALLDRYLAPDWRKRAADLYTWVAVDRIPDEEIWAVRCRLRENFVTYVRDRGIADRLSRGEHLDHVQAATRLFESDVLTVGFARRVATYKRLHLLASDSERARRLLDDPCPIQLVVAGKAHPADEEAKRSVQRFFDFKNQANAANRLIFLEDYDMSMAARLVRGCDVWVNLPRAPMEASGTSGMKAALNGGLQLSVLDGWWGEAYDGENGWAIPADRWLDQWQQDARDAATLYDLLQSQVIPLYYERNAYGVPTGLVRMIKASLKSIGPRFNATRMLNDYFPDE